jgi:tetratricopeptide (TPR) repeat protein
VLGDLLPSDGFPPLTLRVFRLAAKDLSLRAVLNSLGGGDLGREHTALKCIALLLDLELVALVAAPGGEEIPTRRVEDSEQDLPFSEQETEEILLDSVTEYKGESLSDRRRARATRRRGASRQATPDSTATADPPPPVKETIPDDPEWFLKKAAELTTMNPLLALGLDPDERPTPIRLDTVRAAFRKRASGFHPDRLSAYSDGSKDAAETVFSAFNTLRDLLDSQAAIDFALKQLAREKSGLKEVTDFDREKARVCGRQAKMHMKHRKWKAAQEALGQALVLDPQNNLMVLRTHFCAGILQEVPFVQAATAVESTEVQGKKYQTERLYRAGWLWRLGDKDEKALRCFQEALRMEPGHLEAKRELRILEKRMAKKDEKPERTVPFARFFKKK